MGITILPPILNWIFSASGTPPGEEAAAIILSKYPLFL